MTRTLGFMAIVGLALTGCGKKDDGDSGAGTGTGTGNACTATATPFPAFGATEVYYRTTIEFEMSEVENDASITVDGVTGTTTIVGNRVVFEPDSPLAPSTTYDVTLNWSCGPTTSNFTTSNIGGPADPASLVDSTYALDLGAGRFVEPPGVGSIIGSVLENEIFIMPTAADATSISFMGAIDDGAGNQDVCTESFAFPEPAQFDENPYFAIQSDLLDLDVAGVSVQIADLEVSGAFAADGSKISGARLKGTLDVSILADLVGSDPCALLVTFGVECQPCADGVSQTCLSVDVDSMEADLVSGLTLVPRDAQTVACDPACGTVTATTCP